MYCLDLTWQWDGCNEFWNSLGVPAEMPVYDAGWSSVSFSRMYLVMWSTLFSFAKAIRSFGDKFGFHSDYRPGSRQHCTNRPPEETWIQTKGANKHEDVWVMSLLRPSKLESCTQHSPQPIHCILVRSTGLQSLRIDPETSRRQPTTVFGGPDMM